MLQLFLYYSLAFFIKNLEYLLYIVLGQDGLICDDVGWWSGFNKCGNIIDDVEIGFYNTVEGMGTNNYIVTPHGSPIGSSIIIVYGARFL